MSATPTPLSPEEVLLEELKKSKYKGSIKAPVRFSPFRFWKTFLNAKSDRAEVDKRAAASETPLQKATEECENVKDPREWGAIIRHLTRQADPATWTSEDILIRELQVREKIFPYPGDDAWRKDIENARAERDRLSGEIAALEKRGLLDPDQEKSLNDARLKQQQCAKQIAQMKISEAHHKYEQAKKSGNEAELRKERDQVLWENLPRLQLSALCFSGGGIRSASFSLGVAEALARCSYTPATDRVDGILTEFDYLSTVSGGGYTGSFLTRWSTNIPEDDHPKGDPPRPAPPRSFEQTVREIARPRYAGSDPEPPPIRNLRSYTSYLAPRGGLFSGDTWTLVATYLRNLILNWSMLLPLLSLLALLPMMNLELQRGNVKPFGTFSFGNFGVLLAAEVLVWISLLCAMRSLPGMQDVPRFHDKSTVPLTRAHLTALCLAAITFSAWAHGRFLTNKPLETWERAILAVLAATALLPFAWSRYGSTEQKRWSSVLGLTHLREYVLGYFLAGLASAGIIAALVFILDVIFHWNDQVRVFKAMPISVWSSVSDFSAASSPATLPLSSPDDRLFSTFAVPVATLAFVLIGWTLNGFISSLESEDDREWWARSGAYLMMFAAAWAVVHGVVLYAGSILHGIAAVIGGVAAPILGGLGFSRFTGSGMAKSGMQVDGKLKQLLARFALPLAAFLALLSLIVLVAWGNDRLINLLAAPGVPAARHYLEYAGALGVMLMLGNWYFNVNTFSMHGLYRNRLMRAFLGSARAERNPDPFTNFDVDDNTRMADAPAIPGAPLHIVNATLNLVATKNLAWLERKAESFTFSALHSGSSRVGYQRTLTYAGERGPTLATTMAISGAAASPNMGYNSSALMTMLMTFFNVRLGWWLPNPGKQGVGVHQYPGPRQALPALRDESTGHTNDSDPWVYLSDGGHFENLGLYEMVWRRCQKIVVIDGSADPQFTMEDLGNAFRKIYIDMGIPIERDQSSTGNIEAGMGESNKHCAIFSIRYECVHANVQNGTLVYIKSSLCSKLPDDVKQYAVQHTSFPHDPTFNQFFREAQFESYRRLGSHVIQHIMDPANPRSGLPTRKTLDDFIQAARAYASSAPHARATFTTRLHEMTEFLESGKARFTIRTTP